MAQKEGEGFTFYLEARVRGQRLQRSITIDGVEKGPSCALVRIVHISISQKPKHFLHDKEDAIGVYI